jgi:PKD repeat protein
LALTPFFDPPLVSESGPADPAFSPSSPLEGGRCYWWRTQGENACGTGSWSQVFHFATVALQSIFYDDMEGGSGNWSHQAGSGTDAWALVTDQSHSPTHAWFHPDPTVVTDSRLWNTNPVQVGAGSTLTFWHRYQFEDGYDGAVLEISTNGGGTWDDLGPYITAGGYNGVIDNCCGNPLANRSAWTNDLTTWAQVEVDLNTYAGQNVLIRWRFGADSSVSDVGWYIDDVQVTGPLPPNPAPALLSITPDTGSAYEQTPVVIEGTGFVDTPNLQLGETWLLSVTLVSSTTIEAVVPAGMPGGVYDLTLINGDCQAEVLVDAFTVTTVEQPITGLVAVSHSPTPLGEPTTLTATVTAGTNVSYAWDFGDGETGSGALVTHTYPASGVYTAVVTASNPVNQQLATTLVEIGDEAIAGLAAENDSPTALGDPTTLTATVTAGTNVSYAWDFGDGATGVGAVLTHTYPANGVYTAVVTASNNTNDQVATTIVQVGKVPIVGLTAENSSPTVLGDATVFTATIQFGTGVTYTWDFGDGATGAGMLATHVYTAAGVYTATVTATNALGSETAITVVTVVAPPQQMFFLPLIRRQ